MPSSLSVARAALVAVETVSLYLTWGLLLTNGTLDMTGELLGSKSPNLPGTSYPVKTSYTGFKPFDDQLAAIVVVFWPTLDGSMPHASLFCFMFYGQFAATYVLFLVEGAKKGHQGKLVAFTLILGLLAQNIFFANIVPLWLLWYLSTSPLVSSKKVSDHVVDISSVNAAPLSIFCGFVVPAVVMALPAPSMISLDLKQSSLAVWQMFPLSVSILQPVISFIISLFLKSGTTQGSNSTLQTIRPVYFIAFTTATIARLGMIIIVAFNSLFPSIFAPAYRGAFSPLKVSQPVAYTPAFKPATIGESFLLAIQFDEQLAGTGLMIWAVTMYLQMDSKVRSKGEWVSIIGRILILWVLAGPAGVVIAAVWARDEIVLGRSSDENMKKTQ